MGVSEDINWLKSDKEGVGKVFLIIAGKGSAGLMELQRLFGAEDWWPVKSYLRTLTDRGLVTSAGGNFELTESGRKVLKGFEAIEYVEQV